jgi:hypothetical protein
LNPAIWERIAAFVLASDNLHYIRLGASSSNALNFAGASPTHAFFISAALSHTFPHHAHVDPFWPHLQQWISLLVPTLRKLDITFLNDLNGIAAFFAPTLAYMPNLRSLSVPDDIAYLRALASLNSLRHLHIPVHPVPSASLPLLLSALATLPLAHLDIRCMTFGPGVACPFKEPSIFGPDGALGSDNAAIANLSPRLQSLYIDCNCFEEDPDVANEAHPTWRLLPLLHLRHLSFRGNPPDELKPDLLRLQSVSVFFGRDPFAVALSLTTTVVELHAVVLNEYQLATLIECPNLEHLACLLAPGADAALPATAAGLCKLRVLQLTYSRGPNPGDVYSRCTPGALSSAVSFLPNLTSLRLSGVIIPQSETNLVLRRAGPRLEILHIPLDRQHEPQFDRLEALLTAAALYCPHLRILDVLEGHFVGQPYPEQVVQNNRRRILGATERLFARAPFLNAGGFRSTILRVCRNGD